MSEVYEPIIRIETGDAQKTVKSLKKDISDLKDVILNLEEGTDDYAAAVKKLQDDQRQLDKVMGLTKKSATALEGSYDALQHQMSLLRKEWKATNDEARRNELSEQINELNNQLKEFDASTGNFQRNVGNYTSALEALDDKTVSFKENMSQMNDTIEPTKAKFESVQKISAGVASGFAAVQGAAALLGKDTKNLEEVFIRVQSAMAIAQGVGGLGDLVEGLGKAKVAFQDLGEKIKAVSKVMGKAGWIGVIVAVTAAIAALVVYLKKKNDEIKDGTAAIKEYNKAALEEVQSVGKEITNLKLLEQIASDTNLEMNQRLIASQKLCEQLGLQWTEENKLKALQGDLKTETEKATEAIINQAKARAALAMIESKAGEVVSLELEKEQIKQTGPTRKDERQARRYNNAVMQSGSGAPLVTATDIMNDRVAAKDNAISQLNTEMEAILNAAGIGVLNAIADGDTEVEETAEEKAAKEAARIKAAALKAAYEERDRLVAEILAQDIEVADEPIGKLDTKVQMQEEGEVLKKVKASMLAIEQTYAGDVIGIEERKLARLKELHQEALNVGDYESQLALQQAIADQEVEIERTKNAEKKRLREEDLATAQAALNATGALLGGIAEMYESDEKNAKKNAGKIKALRIAEATINTINGAIGAYTQAAATIPPPAGQIIGAVQAAAVTAMGLANINKIRQTKIGDSSSSGGGGSVTPSVSTYSSELPVNYTRNLTSASEVEELNKDTRVVLVESDVFAAIEKNRVRISESEF